MLTSLVIGGALRFSGNNGWPSVCHWLRLRRNFVSSCALEYNLILRNSADIIMLGHLNRQIVHCRFCQRLTLCRCQMLVLTMPILTVLIRNI